MKIGIVTIMDYDNYGNRLQNYAVTYILKKYFNCDAVTLATDKNKPYSNGNFTAWLKQKFICEFCRYPSISEKRLGADNSRWSNFTRWNKNIPIRTIYECDKLPKSLNDEFDYFFVGSDQVWNYEFSSVRFDDYFLKFADDKKKVALSASLGVSDITPEWQQDFTENLEKFSYISVREDEGAQALGKLLNKEIKVLVDPVMVLDSEEWLKVSKKPRVDCKKPYILKYYLGDDNEQTEKINAWAEKNGYEIYELLNKDIPELYSAGPGEFISLINNAALVCSDSFHCLAFSILLSTPFIAFTRLGSRNNMSSRLVTLLNKFGFRDRWSNIVSENEYLKCDFDYSREVLKKEKETFLNYISEILKV